MTRPPWLTDERLVLYPRALALALAVAFVLVVLSADGAETVGGRLGGDYAAFHGAGTLLLEGRAADLFDPEAQQAAQRLWFPDEPGSYLYFAYPPVVAVLYAPLAAMGFVPGYALHTLLAAGAVGLAVRWLPRGEDALPPFALFAALLLLFPLTRAVFGGQNTPFTLAVLAGAWALARRERAVASGAAAALLLLKPQLGLPLIGLMALREPRTLLGAVPVALALYGACAAVSGPGWLEDWLAHVQWFQAASDQIDADRTVGILGFGAAWLGHGTLATGIAWVAEIGLALGLVALWRTERASSEARWALTALGVVLLAPHSLLYDAGLAAVGLVVWSGRMPFGAWLVLLVSSWAGAAGPRIGVSPLVPWMLVSAYTWLRSDRRRTPGRPSS